jgi:hypothetical protein
LRVGSAYGKYENVKKKNDNERCNGPLAGKKCPEVQPEVE